MKYLLLSLFAVLVSSISYAQSNINGRILDKADRTPLTNATVILLNQDSILQYHTRANEDGAFEFKKIKNTNYILIIS